MAASAERTTSQSSGPMPHLVGVSPPPGLHAIYTECRRIYPDQPNPLQVTAVVKYWYLFITLSVVKMLDSLNNISAD